jgi:DNA polymerase-3 subunit epsilon
MNFVAIDFETANYQPNSACAVGVVKVVNGKIVDEASYLIKPPTREFVFTYIHGLTWRDVAKEADFGEIWPKVQSLLEGVEFLAAHNASFDRRVLEACCATYRIPAPSLPFQCTVQVARRTWGIYPTKLSNVCE